MRYARRNGRCRRTELEHEDDRRDLRWRDGREYPRQHERHPFPLPCAACAICSQYSVMTGRTESGGIRPLRHPQFLIGQTVIVAAGSWSTSSAFRCSTYYPFILLNLAFSLQAAYAAP